MTSMTVINEMSPVFLVLPLRPCVEFTLCPRHRVDLPHFACSVPVAHGRRGAMQSWGLTVAFMGLMGCCTPGPEGTPVRVWLLPGARLPATSEASGTLHAEMGWSGDTPAPPIIGGNGRLHFQFLLPGLLSRCAHASQGGGLPPCRGQAGRDLVRLCPGTFV